MRRQTHSLHRYYLSADGGRLGLPGGGARSVQPQGGGLGDFHEPGDQVGGRRIAESHSISTTLQRRTFASQ